MSRKLIVILIVSFVLVTLGCTTAPERTELKAVEANVEQSLAESNPSTKKGETVRKGSTDPYAMQDHSDHAH